MYIEKIKLENFRNIINEEIIFSKDINIIYGNNAQGKTNIIEAISLLANGKSFRTSKDKEIINFDMPFYIVDLEYIKNGEKNKIYYAYDNQQNKKAIKHNGVMQTKISNIIGKVNIVIFKPEDISLVNDGPTVRRRFLDIFISSISKKYLESITKYIKLVEEKNILLKNIKNKIQGNISKIEHEDSELLDVYDEILSKLNQIIYSLREEYIKKLENKMKNIHQKVSGNENEEKIEIKYISNVDKDVDKNKNKIIASRKNDIFKGYSNIGIHRDDFVISLNNLDVSIYGSQGQKKSTVLSLKLSEVEVLEDVIGEKPILLLDDYMSELDNNRRKNLLEVIQNVQIIITTTDKIEIDGRENKFFNIKNGKVKG